MNPEMQVKHILITAAICAARALGAVIVPGATWADTSGNVIQAHGGGFLKVGNEFWKQFDLQLITTRSGPPSTGLVKTNRITAVFSRPSLAIQYASLQVVANLLFMSDACSSPMILFRGLATTML